MAIVFRSVCKRFGENRVINDFSFSIKKGEITYLLGPNGCGKTTLIYLMLGLVPIDSGNITFDGKPIERCRDAVSVVFDEPPVYPNNTAHDNLFLLSQRTKIQPEHGKMLDSLGMDRSLLKNKAKALSLGQKHRLAIAAALIRNPEYIILDEPAIGLDAESWTRVKHLLLDMARNGKTVIVTGHHYDLMEDFVDSIVVIAKGQILFSGSLVELRGRKPVDVEIKTSDSRIVRYGFTQSEDGIFVKTYLSQSDFEKELLAIQEETIKFTIRKYHERSLKELYNDLLAESDTARVS